MWWKSDLWPRDYARFNYKKMIIIKCIEHKMLKRKEIIKLINDSMLCCCFFALNCARDESI